MNRIVVLGTAMFFAAVGIALMGSDNSAVAGHGCHGRDGAACDGGHRCGGRKHRCGGRERCGGLFSKKRNRCCGEEVAACPPSCSTCNVEAGAYDVDGYQKGLPTEAGQFPKGDGQYPKGDGQYPKGKDQVPPAGEKQFDGQPDGKQFPGGNEKQLGSEKQNGGGEKQFGGNEKQNGGGEKQFGGEKQGPEGKDVGTDKPPMDDAE